MYTSRSSTGASPMAFLRAASNSCRTVGAFRTHLGRYSTSAPASKPTWPLYLSVAGCVGLGTYVYLDWNKSPTAAPQAQNTSPLDPANFVDFKLKKIVPYNHNTSIFTFELPDRQASLLPIASCVVVKSPDPDALKDAKGKPVVRPYTPISPSNATGELTFLIKKYDSGNASKYIHEMKVGDSLSIKGPIKKWDYQLNEFDQVALIGGGSGITPLFQILDHALSLPENKTRFKLIFANTSESDILLKENFDAMEKKFPNNLEVVYVVERPDKAWNGPSGFIDESLLKQHLAPASLNNKLKIFVCGPPGQVAAVSGKKDGMKQGELGGILKDLGYSSEQVFKF